MTRLLEIPLTGITPDKKQPRKDFTSVADPDSDLVASIREHGVLQPIIVRAVGDTYVIVAGERRWRASGSAGRKTIPALLIDKNQVQDDEGRLDEASVLVLALTENVQRESLSDIEIAESLARLMLDFGITQGDLAKRIGKSEATVSKLMQLTKLENREDLLVCRPSKDGKGIANTLSEYRQLPRPVQVALQRIRGNTGLTFSEGDFGKVSAFLDAGNSLELLESNIDTVLATTLKALQNSARDYQGFSRPTKAVLKSVQDKSGRIFSELELAKLRAYIQAGHEVLDSNIDEVLATPMDTLAAMADESNISHGKGKEQPPKLTAPLGKKPIVDPLAVNDPGYSNEELGERFAAAMRAGGAQPAALASNSKATGTGEEMEIPPLEINGLKLSGHQVKTLLKILGADSEVAPFLAHNLLLVTLSNLH